MEWIHRQVLHDLRCVALACGDARQRIVGLSNPKDRPKIEETLLSVLDDKHLNCPIGDMGDSVRKVLQIGAWQQSDDPEMATFSIAILLADVWNTSVGFGSPDQDWSDLSPFIMNIPPARRAVLLRAYFELYQMGICKADSFPNPNQYPTENADEIMSPLCCLARKMTEDELNFVSQADYGCDVRKHLTALYEVLDQPDCRFPKDECLYPNEVVELISHDPSSMGFVGCTALLIINDIHSSGHHDYMSFRWMNNSKDYCGLSDSQREPILRGIRHLYETDKDGWDPTELQFGKKRDKQVMSIPYYDSGSAA